MHCLASLTQIVLLKCLWIDKNLGNIDFETVSFMLSSALFRNLLVCISKGRGRHTSMLLNFITMAFFKYIKSCASSLNCRHNYLVVFCTSNELDIDLKSQNRECRIGTLASKTIKTHHAHACQCDLVYSINIPFPAWHLKSDPRRYAKPKI